MNKPQAVIAYVPASKQIFTLSETAKLLALARWPEVQGRRISYPLRFNAPHTHGSVLTDDDNAALTEIWRRAKLTPPSFPMSESEWGNYMRAFERSKAKPNWALGCCVDDDALTHGMLRAAAEEQFMRNLVEAIRAGSIAARDPLTHLPCTDVRALVGQSDLLLSRADVEQFADSAMIAVQAEPSEDAALARAGRVAPATSESHDVRPGRQRVDAIGREVDAAIARIQSRDTRALINQHTVMAELLGNYRQGATCITGHTANGDAITWRTDGGKDRKLDKDALRKRLQNRSAGG